jgi:hypothetical protein
VQGRFSQGGGPQGHVIQKRQAEVFFAGKIVVKRTLGNPGGLQDFSDAGIVESFSVNQSSPWRRIPSLAGLFMEEN